MALDVLFCKDLIVNAANSPVRTFTLFPKRYFHFMVWAVGTGKYLKPKTIIILLFNIKMLTIVLIFIFMSIYFLLN